MRAGSYAVVAKSLTGVAGQRAEGFYVDLGSIFDLADLRPFQNLHLIPSPAAPGVNGTQGLNVHTIAIQVPKKKLTEVEMLEINRLYRIIGHDEEELGRLQKH